MNWLPNSFLYSLFMLGWKDIFELLFFTILLYRISVWLNKDKMHALVWYLYSYCLLILASYHLELSLIFTGLVTYAPVMATLFIVIHQDTLAKHFKTPYKIVPARLSSEWHDELIQSCLITMNNKKQVIGIIEHDDNLDAILSTSYPINTQLQKNTTVLLLESSLYDQNALIWLSSSGSLKGINCTWIKEIAPNTQWEPTVQVSTKNNILAFKCNPDTNSFDVALQGSLIEQISSNNFRSILIQYLHKNSSKSSDKSYKHLNKEEQKHEKTTH
ncbi:MAG TPA: hypothetical protein PKD74_00890 [Candidatus Dependentiae bacterium]|nr:hypothetical protein [Candidatus Dependentiae bacterium]